MFKVIHPFADSQDNGHVYRTGDTYPREGVEPTAVRLIELGSTSNGRGFPLIEEIAEKEEIPFCEPVPAEEAEATAIEEVAEKPEQPKQKKTTAPKAPAKKPGGRRAVAKK